MNRLEGAVRAIMHARQLGSVTDAAAATDIPRSLLAKILRGGVGLSPEKLRKLVTKLTPDTAQQFQILRAHLFDEAERSGFDINLLEISSRQNTADEPISFRDLPESLQKNLRALGGRVVAGDQGLADALTWLAGLIETAPHDFPQETGVKKPKVAEKKGHRDRPKPPAAPVLMPHDTSRTA